jgi:hypothetical protein
MSEPLDDIAVYLTPISVAANPISEVPCVKRYLRNDIGRVSLSVLCGDVR